MACTTAFIIEQDRAWQSWGTYPGGPCLVTDVSNLPSILQTGALLSRHEVEHRSLLKVDCADEHVLGRADPWVGDYVRLYLRVRTPMLWTIEGIKPPGTKEPHCPIPVYLVFSPHILCIPGVLVSDGNMASAQTSCNEATDDWVKGLPYGTILYPGNPYRSSVRLRHAEVLVPGRLSLERWLSVVAFRSAAERQLGLSICPASAALTASNVRPDWFYASDLARPYLRECNLTDLTLDIANPAMGLAVDTYGRETRDGSVWMHRMTFDGRAWVDGTPPSPVDNAMFPAEAKRACFIHGVRVAYEAFPRVVEPRRLGAMSEVTFNALLRVLGHEVIDLREKGGALWIVGGRDLQDDLTTFTKQGISFTFAPSGGTATRQRPAWWTKWRGTAR